MDDPKRLARMFKALSVEARVRIVQLLKGRALCVGALSARLEITQGAVSQHLRVLRDSELVIDDKRGCFVHYSVNEETLASWKDSIVDFLDADTTECGCGEQERGEKLCLESAKAAAAAAKSQRT